MKDFSPVEIIEGDCRKTLAQIPDKIANCCVTSPPYFGLRNYGVNGQIGLEESLAEYITQLVVVFREVRRILKDDGTLWLNLGDSYNNFRSTMGPGQTFHKDQDLRGKPAPKSKSRGQQGFKEKDLLMVPARVAIALQEDGWYLRSDIIWHKPNPMPESVRDRPTSTHEHVFLLSKNQSYYYDYLAIVEEVAPSTITRLNQDIENQTGSERANGGAKTNGNIKAAGNTEYRNSRNVWTITTKPFKDAHFATMPIELAEKCLLAGCPVGGTVVDPFFGAGTTGLAAIKNNRNAIGTELNPEYIEIAKKRINSISKDVAGDREIQNSLFEW